MLRNRSFWRAFIISVALASSACATGQLPVAQVYQSSQCAVADKSLRLLNSPEEVSEVLAPQLQGLEPNTSKPAPDINFSDEQPVLIAWGRKGSPGYIIELENQQAQLKDGTVRLPVRFDRPHPDKLYAQVMTSFCLIVTLPKADYKKIIAGDLETSRD
jgi:hypothetical protein